MHIYYDEFLFFFTQILESGGFLSVLVCCCLQVTGLYEYKVFGELASCSPQLCADVYMDLTYRKDWDKYAKGKNWRNSGRSRSESF